MSRPLSHYDVLYRRLADLIEGQGEHAQGWRDQTLAVLKEYRRQTLELEQVGNELRQKVVEYFVADELESQLLTIERFQVLPPSELEAEMQAIQVAHDRTAAAYRALREVALDEINALYGDAGSAQEDV